LPNRISASFPDIGVLGRAAGFDVGFRQLDAGPASVAATLLRGEQLTLVSMTLNRAYHQLGTPPAGMKSFGIPLRPMRNWFGGQYRESSILPFNVPGGIDGVSESGFAACTLSVSDDSLQRVSDAFRVPVGDVLITPRTDMVIRNSRATQLFRRLLYDDFEDETRKLDREREEEIIVALLCAALSGPATIDKSNPASRARAISKALVFIHEQEGAAITVGDICRNTGVALRTLNRAFRERFGVGPKAYLTRKRLSNVHAELVRAPGNTVIADVANRHAFWHLGQFAKDYKTMFGELPSETLKWNRAKPR
jgi:AraC-like DNA-binding protein